MKKKETFDQNYQKRDWEKKNARSSNIKTNIGKQLNALCVITKAFTRIISRIPQFMYIGYHYIYLCFI